MLNRITLIIILLFQISCADHTIQNYEKEGPKLTLKEFFNGKLYALGIVQDRSGAVIKRFRVDMVGTWKGDIGTLDEKFIYSDGSKSERIWTLTKTNNQSFNGTADDVEGIAKGEVSGNTFFFEYVLDLPVGDTSYHVKLDDWMFLLDSNTLMARSYMSKWGFDLGEITIVMMKRD